MYINHLSLKKIVAKYKQNATFSRKFSHEWLIPCFRVKIIFYASVFAPNHFD